MLAIRVRDFALLSCSFSERTDNEASEEQGGEATESFESFYPDEHLLQLAVTAETEEEEIVCIIEGKLDDDRLPFELSFEIAFLFALPDEEVPPNIEEIQPTLIWLAFPHLREFVANLTGRSTAPQYFLPPLTRLPHPEHGPEGEEQRDEDSRQAG
jgi:hypothetical protein